jgi:hypothetical protein
MEHGWYCSNGQETLDDAHRTFLVNFSHLFFDNLYQEDNMAFSDKDNFLRVFVKFADTELSPDKFERDKKLMHKCIKN